LLVIDVILSAPDLPIGDPQITPLHNSSDRPERSAAMLPRPAIVVRRRHRGGSL